MCFLPWNMSKSGGIWGYDEDHASLLRSIGLCGGPLDFQAGSSRGSRSDNPVPVARAYVRRTSRAHAPVACFHFVCVRPLFIIMDARSSIGPRGGFSTCTRGSRPPDQHKGELLGADSALAVSDWGVQLTSFRFVTEILKRPNLRGSH